MSEGKICVSVCASTAAEMIAKVKLAQEFADIVEVRFDCLEPDQLEVCRSEISNLRFEKPILATLRSPVQGGHGRATREERIEFWNSNASDFSLIDLEEDIAATITRGETRIASHHDFAGVPSNLKEIFEMLVSSDCDIVKIAITANDISDTIEIWKLTELARRAGKQMIPIAMGEAGKWTRILGLAHGAFLTYVSLDPGAETAPGQVSAKEISELYRAKDLDLQTKVYGIIGDPIGQSLSPAMHNPALVSSGVNGVFIPFLVKDVDEFMQRMVKPATREIDLNLAGFAVTMPHKESIMKHLDMIDPVAAKIGAVNTVQIEDGNLIGYNTDAYGFITPLKERFGVLKGAKTAILGAGGAARACVYALLEEGAEVEVFVRDVGKARAFGEEFGVPVSAISDLRSEISGSSREGGRFDIVVDTTPTGMSGASENESLLSSEQLKGVKFVYDLVTKPYDTPIIREAKKAGISAIGGIEMLVGQGAKQFEIWTGQQAPVELMRKAALSKFAERNR